MWSSAEFGFMEMYKRLILPKGCIFIQRNVIDKLGSGRGTSHTGIIFHNLLGCAAWRYKGAILFLKLHMHWDTPMWF